MARLENYTFLTQELKSRRPVVVGVRGRDPGQVSDILRKCLSIGFLPTAQLLFRRSQRVWPNEYEPCRTRFYSRQRYFVAVIMIVAQWNGGSNPTSATVNATVETQWRSPPIDESVPQKPPWSLPRVCLVKLFKRLVCHVGDDQHTPARVPRAGILWSSFEVDL